MEFTVHASQKREKPSIDHYRKHTHYYDVFPYKTIIEAENKFNELVKKYKNVMYITIYRNGELLKSGGSDLHNPKNK